MGQRLGLDMIIPNILGCFIRNVLPCPIKSWSTEVDKNLEVMLDQRVRHFTKKVTVWEMFGP